MEEFVYLNKEDSAVAPTSKHDFYSEWAHNHASAKHSDPALAGADVLRRLYPQHSLVMSTDYRLQLLTFPGAYAVPLEDMPLVTNLFFLPLKRSLGSLPGVLIDQVDFGAFKLAWDTYDFLLFIVQYPSGFGMMTQSYILHEGPDAPTRSLLVKAGSWAEQLHEDIWVFNQGFWRKDHGLWQEVQKANWIDVILKEEFKNALRKDVEGFFSSKQIYQELGISWKRGLIMFGPPGNGKTISLKAIMKSCDDSGSAPLYVKSFQSYQGEEGAMSAVFDKARQLAPCVVILEDLDSLINDRNRSFFLNQLDGLEGNDGILIIGTTNHFDRLDPGLSNRPSRFDRHFKFDNPEGEERALYVKYWQKKLENNKEISFTEDLAREIVDSTEQFSFAYLKEAFVSSLVTLATYEGTKPSFAAVIRDQIKTLRKELDKPKSVKKLPNPPLETALPLPNLVPKRPARPDNERDIHALLDALSESFGQSRIFTSKCYPQESHAPRDHEFRLLLDKLSESMARGDITPERAYSALRPSASNSTSREVGEGVRHQPIWISQRTSPLDERRNVQTYLSGEFPNEADNTIYRNEVRLSQSTSGSGSTFGTYNYPECLSQRSQHVWGP